MAKIKLHRKTTIFFVFLAAILIATCISLTIMARERMNYLERKISDVDLIIVSLKESGLSLDEDQFLKKLFQASGAQLIAYREQNSRHLVTANPVSRQIDFTYDISGINYLNNIVYCFKIVFSGQERLIRITGPSPFIPENIVEIVIDESIIISHLKNYSIKVFSLSLVFSILLLTLVHRFLSEFYQFYNRSKNSSK